MSTTFRHSIMSMPFARVGPGHATGNPLRRLLERRFALTRTALIRTVLVALVAVLGCGAVPGPGDPAPSRAGCAGEPARGSPKSGCHNGEFTGRYHEGLPVYAFPTIYVVGHRTQE